MQTLAATLSLPVMSNRPPSTLVFEPSQVADEPIDRAFFESAVGAIMDRLYGSALRYTRNATDAEDLLADTLLKAWNSIDQLDERGRFDGWIMRILSNTFISNVRRSNKHATIFDDDVPVGDLDDTESLYGRLHQPFLLWYGSPEKAFVNNLLNEDIQRALDALSEGYRVVVVMVELLGFTYEEASDSLEIPIGTVRSRLNRGRKMMQQALWHNARDAGLVKDTQPTNPRTS